MRFPRPDHAVSRRPLPLALALALCSLAAMLLSGCAALFGPPQPDTRPWVYLVRHAEKVQDGSADPPLSAAGQARAALLATGIQHAGITGILSTPYRRTRETAAPAARWLGLSVEELPISGGLDAHVSAVVARVRSDPEAQWLIVGHSNTLAPILAGLGGPAIDDLTEDAYGDVLILHRDGSLSRGRFGP